MNLYSRPALFLDRDGVIIEDSGYVGKVKDVKIIKEISPIIKWANEKGWYVCIVTNQSGVARGFYNLEDCNKIHEYIEDIFKKEKLVIDKWYICPHHVEGSVKEYAIECDCRKPKSGLIYQALSDFPISLAESFIIGDKVSDCIKVDGLKSLLIQGKYSLEEAPDLSTVYNSFDDILNHLRLIHD